ncbi:unnamed protein product, partial [Schistosoma rodhaini]
MFKCSIVHKCESLKSANELLAALHVCYATDENYPPDETTLPLNTDKQNSALKRKESFLYNSVDMDVAEMQAGNTRVQYPKLRMFENVVSPIANSTQVDSSPSTSEDKNLTAQFERMYTLQLKMSASLSEISTNIKLLLSRFSDCQDPRQFDCGLSSQQFPLSSEEELGTLDACLEQKDVRDRF